MFRSLIHAPGSAAGIGGALRAGNGRLEWAEATERDTVSSVYIPAKDEPGPDEILEALREAMGNYPKERRSGHGTEGTEGTKATIQQKL